MLHVGRIRWESLGEIKQNFASGRARVCRKNSHIVNREKYLLYKVIKLDE